jgi:hypothetical protein
VAFRPAYLHIADNLARFDAVLKSIRPATRINHKPRAFPLSPLAERSISGRRRSPKKNLTHCWEQAYDDSSQMTNDPKSVLLVGSAVPTLSAGLQPDAVRVVRIDTVPQAIVALRRENFDKVCVSLSALQGHPSRR